MSYPYTMAEETKIVEGLEPAADAAGRAGDWVSVKNLLALFVICHIDQGHAATIDLTLFQATDVAGTDAKVLTNDVPIWSNLDCAASDALVRRTDAKNYTTDAGVKHKIVNFQVDPASLDINNSFDCVKITTGASNAANITEAMYFGVPRYAGDNPPGGPSVIVD